MLGELLLDGVGEERRDLGAARGMVPNGKPISVPRIHGPNERFQSSAFIQIEPRWTRASPRRWFSFEAK
jgi:hypothetical protein